jgi:prepilin-type N-terminal cleavage/methylation domain-containing protein
MHPRIVGRPPRRALVGSSSAFHKNALQRSLHAPGFTLIELLVVIAIIAILVGLLFPAFKAVQNQARQTQAKNDPTQIVNAVNAYYTEYGQYPLGITADTTYGPGGAPNTNETLFRELRGCRRDRIMSGAATSNARRRFHFATRRQKRGKSASGIGSCW